MTCLEKEVGEGQTKNVSEIFEKYFSSLILSFQGPEKKREYFILKMDF